MRRIKTTWILVFTLSILLGTAEYASAVPPANDNCSNAQAIGNVTNQSFDTTEATFDGPGHFIISPNIWYVYTAPYTGCATVSLCGSNYDTMLAVYDGSSCPPSLGDLLASNDDYCFRQSDVVFPVIGGNQYLIEVGGYFQETGTGLASALNPASQRMIFVIMPSRLVMLPTNPLIPNGRHPTVPAIA